MSIKENQNVREKRSKKVDKNCNTKRSRGHPRKSVKSPRRNSRHGWKGIDFTPVSAEVIFKTIVLLMVLIVAAIAMVKGITDAAVWAFLTMIAGYVAFTAPQSSESKKKG